MSLLIDALKQAEASRRQADQPPADVPTSVSDSLALEPLASAEQAKISAAAIATSTPPNSSRTPSASGTGRAANAQAARELFEVKQKSSSPALLIITIVGLILLVAGGAYLWWATHPHGLEPGPGLISTGNPAPNLNVTVQPAPQQAPLVNNGVMATPITDTSGRTQTPPAKIDAHLHIAARSNTRSASKPTASQSPAQEIDSGLPTVRRSDVAPQNGSPSQVQRAYESWQAGDLIQARNRYRDVLQQEPRNIDALDALGMIALRNKQPDVAEHYFRDALVVDPKDATAVSQLTLLYADGDPVTAESRLRALMTGQPDSSIACFALGSLMAKQGRWSEAQPIFFRAYTLDGSNPDVLYNLAISLDHLHQNKPAQQYYERAVQAAVRRPASFDPVAAKNRAETLANIANATR